MALPECHSEVKTLCTALYSLGSAIRDYTTSDSTPLWSEVLKSMEDYRRAIDAFDLLLGIFEDDTM